jgi:hypothetical protein
MLRMFLMMNKEMLTCYHHKQFSFTPIAMNVFTLVHMVTGYALEKLNLAPGQLYEQVSPLSNPPYRSAGIRSPDVHVDNPVYNEYLKFWTTGTETMIGVHKWITLISLIRNKYPYFLTVRTWDDFIKLVRKIVPDFLQLNEWKIPMIRPVPPYDVAVISGVPYSEYQTELQLSPRDFMQHIVQIVLFGFPVNPQNQLVFRISSKELSNYVRERIAQGVFDEYLRGDSKLRTSYFLPDQGISSAESAHLLEIGKATIPFMKQAKMFPGVHVSKTVENHLNQVQNLGSMHESVRAMQRLRAFQRLSRKYQFYLENAHLGANTSYLGPRGFEMLVRANEYAQGHAQLTMAGGPAVVPEVNPYEELF